MKKAADYVNEGHKAINDAISAIDNAMEHVESSTNKSLLQKAKSSLDATCSELGNFND